MNTAVQGGGNDTISFRYCVFNEIKRSETIAPVLPDYNKRSVTGHEAMKDILKLNNMFHWYVWQFCYRRKWWIENGFNFEVGHNYEDTLLVYRLLLNSKAMVVCPSPIVKYRIRKGSITQTHNIRQLKDKAYAESKNINEVLSNPYINGELKDLLLDTFASGYFGIMLHASASSQKKEVYELLKTYDYYKYSKRSPQKLLAIFVRVFGIRFTCFALSLIRRR